MNIDKNYYAIVGYDLTNYKTDKYDDWRWTEEGEKYTCNQKKGEIQLFDDPMNNSHLYLGYILAAGDEYDFKTSKFDIIELEQLQLKVEEELERLSVIGIIDIEYQNVDYEVIVFEECS